MNPVMRRASAIVRPLLVLVVALAVSACAIKLAPDYDRTIVDGLTRANEKALVLYAAVSAGSPSEKFEAREAEYNELIGLFDAIRVQAKARPVPRPYLLQVLGVGSGEGVDPEQIERLQAPTAGVLDSIVANITRLRDVHRERGLSSAIVVGMKRSYEISIDQALTFEKALER